MGEPRKMKMNNTILIIGVACLAIGGLTGAWIANENAKVTGTEKCMNAIMAAAQNNPKLMDALQNEEYLEKNKIGGLGCYCGSVCAGYSGEACLICCETIPIEWMYD
jgi:hypothetical protein